MREWELFKCTKQNNDKDTEKMRKEKRSSVLVFSRHSRTRN